jgi:NADH-quinone oxidoreductase subunit L
VRDPLPGKLGVVAQWLSNRFYLDELYEATFIRLHDMLAGVADWVDRWLIAGLGVRGVHGTTEIVGRILREVQTGNLQTYAFLFAIGVALLLFFMLK